MIRDILNYFSGVVIVRVSGPAPERFINLCIANGILLWNISSVEEDFIVSMPLQQIFRIRPLVRLSKNRVRIEGYYGFPFVAKKIKRRKMLVVGLLIFLVSLNYLTSYIWFVEIIGTKMTSPETVKQIVYQNGLKPGVYKESINVRQIENAVLFGLPEAAWVGVRMQGTKAVVEVVEKTFPQKADRSPADIVANKDGIVTEIIVLAGQPAVKRGDTVRRGDILIKGITEVDIPNTVSDGQSGQNVRQIQHQSIRAKGIVRAKVWYEGYGEQELRQVVKERTGRSTVGVTINFGNNTIVLKKPVHSFQVHETELIHKKIPFWRNSGLAVESTICIVHELTDVLTEFSREEARNLATAKAVNSLQAAIPETVQILARYTEVLNGNEANLIRVKVRVEAIEDIGQILNTRDN